MEVIPYRLVDKPNVALIASTAPVPIVARRHTCLAPDIVEAILDGRQPKGLRLAEVLGNGPGSWEDQRRAFGFRQSA
jgi:hypothetical protein